MKKIILLSLIAVSVLSCKYEKTSKNTESEYAIDTLTDFEKEKITEEKQPIWEYEETIDKMNETKTKIASIEANEELLFDFPYDGGSTAKIVLRNKNGNTNVFLTISKGQFITQYDNRYIKTKFDNQKPKTQSVSESSDGSSDILFINSEKTFISKLKNSKKLIIEAEFYQEGLKQMEFNTEGLDWK